MAGKIWRKNFAIQQVDYIMMTEAMISFFEFQQPSVKMKYLTEGFSVFESGDNSGTFFEKTEMRSYVNAILKEIITDPGRIKKIQNKTTEYNKKYFRELKKAEKINYSRQSDKKLLEIFHSLYELMKVSHGHSLPTTWFVDADNEILSNYLLNFVKTKIEKNELNLTAPEVFSVLTTPDRESMAQKEEIEMLNIFKEIIKDKTAGKIFKNENANKIESDLNKLKKGLRDKMLAHYKKWRWTPYTYIGPAYNLDYYLSIWSSLVRQKVKPEHEIKRLLRARKETKNNKGQFIKALKLTKKEITIFEAAAQIVWLKAFRKDVLFYGMYIADKILKELGRRAGLSLMQMKYIANLEMGSFRKLTADELNQRYKFSLIYSRNGKLKIYSGDQAKRFLKKQNFEKIVIKPADELKGTPAYVGKVKGKVKIINLPEEMGKMEKGNIMVAHTTYPSLVPAMKKAAAIVTDDGGITCHAAIVARELKTPCIVGTKIATRILKDGDMVEVDAESGIVKILKKL